jgi:hypothetical protein
MEMTTSPATNYVSLALSQEEQIKYAELKVKITNDLPVSNDELTAYKGFSKKITEVRGKQEKLPKLNAFVEAAKELLTLGFKTNEIITAIKGGTVVAKPETVVAVFPEIKIADASGNLVPFEYKAGKKYAGRGIEADAIKKVKAKGLDYMVKHFNEDGKTWFEEKEAGKRDATKIKFPNKEYLNKFFGVETKKAPSSAKPIAKKP